MKHVIKALALVLTTSLAAPAFATEPAGTTTSEKAMKPNWKNITEHLNKHQKYPATKAQLVAECQNLSDFSATDKQWFAATLPEGTYNSADEVVAALKKGTK
jgi:hypothetical protein